jgi:hypothetical protein
LKNKKANNHQRVLGVLQPKKAQLKIQQMTFMLLAITLFFILALLFFLAVKVVDLERDAIESQRDKAANLAGKISSNPELIFEDDANSIDADKLMILQRESKYRDYFGVKGIIVEKIYPPGSSVDCDSRNYPNCNKIKLFTISDSAPTKSFVSWCSKQTVNGNSYDKCELAILMIEEFKP